MERKTLAYALAMLDNQRAHTVTAENTFSGPAQAAYYDGMRVMLEAIISEAYTENVYVVRENGKHTILA